MHEIHPVEKSLQSQAQKISRQFHGAPVVIIVAGSRKAEIPRCMLGSTLHAGTRLRDLVGILETVKQIETLKHFQLLPPGEEA
jgi:hypothetical protein